MNEYEFLKSHEVHYSREKSQIIHAVLAYKKGAKDLYECHRKPSQRKQYIWEDIRQFSFRFKTHTKPSVISYNPNFFTAGFIVHTDEGETWFVYIKSSGTYTMLIPNS